MRYYLDDFSAGQVFDTRRRTITEADIVMFSGWSWDTNPVHTDATAAAGSRFGTPIAQGLLGMSVAMGLVANTGVFEYCSVALLAVREWSFRAPIFAGDTLACRVEIVQVRPTSSGTTGVLQRRFTLSNQREDVVQEGYIDLMVATSPQS